MSQDTKRSLFTYQLVGAVLVILLVFGLGGWAAWASINGAVIASATVVVESNAKKVQHVEGGIISEIHVETGDHVTAGDLLVRLDQTEPKAELSILNARLNELHASHARLKTERDGLDDIDFGAELNERAHDAEVQNILDGQRRLFLARAKDRRSKKEQLSQRILQLNEEITGLKAQQVAKEEQIELIGGEVEGLRVLREKKLVPKTRLLALQRERARLDGERGQLVAQIARAKGRIAETELVIIEVDQEARTEVLTELREVEANLVEYLARRSAARTRLDRTDIFAPQTGIVHEKTVHTIGGVVTASEPLMLIVPERDELVLEAQVSPSDIDQVKRGQDAVVRFASFDRRTTPELNGTVTRVGADLTQLSPDIPPYYIVRITLLKDELDRLDGKALKPGMPAEVFIQTGARTALSYLLKPLTDQIAYTFRER